jgi:hypothetical protein
VITPIPDRVDTAPLAITTMAMENINYIKAKAHISTSKKAEEPVLSEEDEKFLNHITSDGNAPPLPARPKVLDLPVAGETKGNDAQVALMNGAQNIPLPDTPNEVTEEPPMLEGSATALEHSATAAKERKTKSTWSWLRRDSRNARRKATAAGLMDVAEGLKHADAKPNEDGVVEDPDAKKEEEDMTIVLERLNLAAVNNRAFSISDETQVLLQQFNQIFKDLVNGVPTAYDDLEKLLKNGDRQLQKTFNQLPTFLQELIERLPNSMTKSFAPEIMAAAAERAEKSGFNKENMGKAAAAAKKMGLKTPSLKDLIGKPGAIAGMLRSVITYLRARFPAFLGMNVLWSLALFGKLQIAPVRLIALIQTAVLLLVFWYCYKRGREVRLEKEDQLTEEEIARLESEYNEQNESGMPTTTAPEGAPMEDVEAGMREVQETKNTAAEEAGVPHLVSPSALSTTVQPAEQTGV